MKVAVGSIWDAVGACLCTGYAYKKVSLVRNCYTLLFFLFNPCRRFNWHPGCRVKMRRRRQPGPPSATTNRSLAEPMLPVGKGTPTGFAFIKGQLRSPEWRNEFVGTVSCRRNALWSHWVCPLFLPGAHVVLVSVLHGADWLARQLMGQRPWNIFTSRTLVWYVQYLS